MKANGTTKAVFISTSAESSFYRRTLRIILEKNNFTECIIICAAHSSILDYSTILPLADEMNYDEPKQQAFNWVDEKYETQVK